MSRWKDRPEPEASMNLQEQPRGGHVGRPCRDKQGVNVRCGWRQGGRLCTGAQSEAKINVSATWTKTHRERGSTCTWSACARVCVCECVSLEGPRKKGKNEKKKSFLSL